jgi:hypothetical protein
VHDSKPYLSRLDRQLTAFNLYPEYVGLDAGYKTAGICKGLEERGIEGVIGYRRSNKSVFTGGGVSEYEEDCAVTATFFTFVGR